MGFALVQLVVALIAESEAMLGDCAAMGVDCLTYGFNLYAERKKSELEDDDGPAGDRDVGEGIELSNIPAGETTSEASDVATRDYGRRKLERQIERKRRNLYLELTPPLLSVSILMIVIGLVLHESIQTLVLDAHRPEKEQSIPNLRIMMTFSVLNLFLDLMNV